MSKVAQDITVWQDRWVLSVSNQRVNQEMNGYFSKLQLILDLSLAFLPLSPIAVVSFWVQKEKTEKQNCWKMETTPCLVWASLLSSDSDISIVYFILRLGWRLSTRSSFWLKLLGGRCGFPLGENSSPLLKLEISHVHLVSHKQVNIYIWTESSIEYLLLYFAKQTGK